MMTMVELKLLRRYYIVRQIESMVLVSLEHEDVAIDDEHENGILFELDW